jgi:hypothetical protein
MSRQITRRLKPEEEEILRKREELATVRATLACVAPGKADGCTLTPLRQRHALSAGACHG